MRKKNMGVLFSVFASAVFLLISEAFAGPAVSNDDLIAEIRELKGLVQRQEQRINDLERQISSQKAGVQPEASVPVSDIDKRIDERLAVKGCAGQVMDGLELSVGVTTVVQGARNANGSGMLSSKEDASDASVSADITLEKSFDDYGKGFVYVTAGQGAGVEDDLQLFSNVNNDADNDQNARLAEVWYERYFGQSKGVFTFGKLDATRYIDTNAYANDETAQFLGRMFRNSPVVEFPSNSAGARFGFAPADIIEADVIAVDADGDWEDVFDAMFIAGQVNFKFKIAGLDGNYRVIGWGNGSNHTRWLNAEKDKEINYGWGLSFDQELTDVLGVFMRYGWQDPKVYTNGSAFSLTHSWSAGPQVKGVLWNRPDDVLGVGIGQILPSKKYKEVNGLKAKPESHLEMYYNFKVNEHFSLSPDLQIIWRPYGKDAVNGDGTIVIGGVRGQMDF